MSNKTVRGFQIIVTIEGLDPPVMEGLTLSQVFIVSSTIFNLKIDDDDTVFTFQINDDHTHIWFYLKVVEPLNIVLRRI